ncbi:MAG TPA: replicative DNA helicase, partial [Gammaproteobacteria bacterium]|nr:replicative DNA helicase [Gammaproteobacteria bacterium]
MTPTPKQPPYNMEAEQSVLGGMMLDNRAVPEVCERVSAEDFYREDHSLIFGAILGALQDHKVADFVTVMNWLKERDQLDEAGGLSYLGALANDTPSAANVRAYADVVAECSQLRKVIHIAGKATELAYTSGGRSVGEILDEVERGVFAIRERGAKRSSGPQDMAQLVELAERGIELRNRMGDTVSGLRTGIRDLDDKTTGLHAGDLVIVAGRPSMGKTSLAEGFASSCAIDQGKWALFFSLEMPAEQIALRAMASRNKIPMQELRRGNLSQQSWDRIGTGNLVLRQAKMMVDETPALSPNDLRARARRAAMRNPLGLIVVDYIQLMQIPGNRENRTNEVAEISRNLKALAKELSVPVVALSQLNRSVETRTDKRPMMSDLRESGAIEQDADVILFIYRDEVYHDDSKDKGKAEIIIAKQRNGP